MTDEHKLTAVELRKRQARQDRERSEAATAKSRELAKEAAKNKPDEPQPDHPVIQTGKGLTDG